MTPLILVVVVVVVVVTLTGKLSSINGKHSTGCMYLQVDSIRHGGVLSNIIHP
jgi:hypothetical protein